MPSPMLESCVQHRIPHPVTRKLECDRSGTLRIQELKATPAASPGCQKPRCSETGERTEEGRGAEPQTERQPRRAEHRSRAPPASESTGGSGAQGREEGEKGQSRGLLTEGDQAAGRQADREEVGLQHGRPFLSPIRETNHVTA